MSTNASLQSLHGQAGQSCSNRRWRVVGLAGVSAGGKSTLAQSILAVLPTTTVYLGMDEYILPDDHPIHPRAPEGNGGLNKESLVSIDMTKMIDDMKVILSSDPACITLTNYSSLLNRGKVIGSGLSNPRPPPLGQRKGSKLPAVLLVDGFLLFNHPEVLPMCDLCYYITLTEDQCRSRRNKRTFTSANMSSHQYFELCVWPSYKEHSSQILNSDTGIHILDGAASPNTLSDRLLKDILHLLESRK